MLLKCSKGFRAMAENSGVKGIFWNEFPGESRNWNKLHAPDKPGVSKHSINTDETENQA